VFDMVLFGFIFVI